MLITTKASAARANIAQVRSSWRLFCLIVRKMTAEGVWTRLSRAVREAHALFLRARLVKGVPPNMLRLPAVLLTSVIRISFVSILSSQLDGLAIHKTIRSPIQNLARSTF